MKHLFAAGSLCLLFLSVSAQVHSYGKAPGGVKFQLDKGLMEIDLLAADVVRVLYTRLDAFQPKQSLVVTGVLQAPDFTVHEQGAEIIIETDKLMISVDRSTNGIAYSDLRGRMLLAED